MSMPRLFAYLLFLLLPLVGWGQAAWKQADTIVRVGRVLIDVRTGTVVGFVDRDTLTSEATLEPEVTSRWLSVDPLAGRFPYMSPYAAFVNNPVLFVDPNGGYNVIYLYVTPNAIKKVNSQDIVKKTNESFANMGLKTKVVLLEQDPTTIDRNKLDFNDRIAIIGTDVDEIKKIAQHFDLKFGQKDGESTWKGGAKFPEKATKKAGDFDIPIIGIDASEINESANSFIPGITGDEFASFLIIHGTGHNAGIDHQTGEGFMISAKDARNRVIVNNPFTLEQLLDPKTSQNQETIQRVIDAFNNDDSEDRLPR